MPRAACAIAAIYPYRDARGARLYEVLRFTPKAFACRTPEGTGWRWNLQGVERVLYRLPELLAARAAGAQIFLTEGEKDADALAALGLAATTHAGGAGKWRPEYTPSLTAAHVVLLPDNDDAGRAHMDTVEQSLRPVAASLRRLDLPDLPAKGDVSDWIDARRAEGHPDDAIRAQLLALARAASPDPTHPALCPLTATHCGANAATTHCSPEQLAVPAPPPGGTPPPGAAATGPPPLSTGTLLPVVGAPLPAGFAIAGIRRLSDVIPRPVQFLWEPYLPLGKLTLLDGDPGQGKSWLTAAIAAAGSHGRGLPDTRPFEPFNTLFFTEDPAEDVLRARLDLLRADCSRVYTCDTFEHPLDLSQPADVLRAEQLVEAYRARLVVIDPIQAFLGAKTDLYRPNEVRAVLMPLLRLAQRHACALLVLRHITKARASRCIYAGQGSVDFIAAARSVLLAGSAPEDPNRHALVHIKSNLAATGPTLAYRFDGRTFRWQGTSRLTANDLLAAEAQPDDAGAEEEARHFLRDLLATSDTLPARAVLAAAREAGVAERTLKRAKRCEGIRTTRQGFGTGSVWLWSLPATPPAAPPEHEECEVGHPQTWPPSPSVGPLRTEPASGDPAPADPEPLAASKPEPLSGTLADSALDPLAAPLAPTASETFAGPFAGPLAAADPATLSDRLAAAEPNPLPDNKVIV